MKKVQLVVVAILFATQIFAQTGVVISETPNDTPDESAILEVKSTTQGILIPRMTSEERDEIVNPVAGLQVFNVQRKCIEFYTGVEWTSSDAAGTIKPFAGKVGNIPDGWFLCDGSPLSRTNYPDLLNAIELTWGIGNGHSTFNIPDLRGVFLRGVTGTRTGDFADPDIALRNPNGEGETNNVGSLQNNATSLPDNSFTTDNPGNHTHGYSHMVQNGSVNVAGGGPHDIHYGSGSTSGNGSHSHIVTGGGDNETRPTNAYVNYIIKY